MPFGEVDLADRRVERRPQSPAAHRRHRVDRQPGFQQAAGEIDGGTPPGAVVQVGKEQGNAD